MSGTQLSATDSTMAMQSLLTAYADNEVDDDTAADDSVTEHHPGASFISDDEEEHRIVSDKSVSRSANDLDEVSISNDLKPDSMNGSPANKRMRLQVNETAQSATRLVSYMDDDQDEDDDLDESGASEEDKSPQILFGKRLLDNATARNGSSVSLLDKVQTEATSQDSTTVGSPNGSTDKDVLLPPEATGKCSKRLQEKVERLFDKMQREGRDLNYEIQKRKDFRNPSIYEKIIEFCGIDEKGTNYPPELYHPDNWVLDENSFYDKLAQAQADLMQKKEKEARKSKVERQIGVKKISSDPPSSAMKHP